MKKIICLCIALAMALSVSISAFAAGPSWGGTTTGNQNLVSSTKVKFYVEINGERLDTNGNISSQKKSYFTGQVASSTLTEQHESSFSVAIGDGVTEADILSYITETPDNGEVLANVIKDFSGKGYIKDTSGNVVSWYALTDASYRVEWYTLKYETNDDWHIDGVVIDRATDLPIEIVVPDNPEDIPPEATEPVDPDTGDEDKDDEDDEITVPSYNDPLELKNEYAYIFGRSDTEMEADDGMKRGEVSAVLYRLLKQNGKLQGFSYDIDDTPVYSDTEGRWDRSALEYMNYIGVYKDADTIGPDTYITRGEAFRVLAIALRFTNNTEYTNEEYAAILNDAGYIEGDESGDLMVDEAITRAEVCTIYNRIIGRDDLDLETIDGVEVTAQTYGFVDLDPGAWYYEDMIKATSAYTDGYVDIEKRAQRNVLDDYS